MPGESFRFIHASDFHLEKPLGDLDQLPSPLRDALAEAPRRAAQRVLESALADPIDFLVLCGDLLSPLAAGPHGMSLLLDHFEQLHAKNKPVFWVAGAADDPQRWPEAVPLPPNVTLFPKNRAVAVPVERSGRTIALVIGRSSEGRGGVHVPSYRIEPTDEFTIAAGYGAADVEALAEGRFDYWALGGEHNRRELEGAGTAGGLYCGSPQGRSLQEPGPHGYTVVDVDADRTTRTRAVECDVFRYCRQRIDAAEIAQVGGIRNLLGERIARLQHEHGGHHLLIGWDISVTDGETLQGIGDADELLRWLRREYSGGSPVAWTAELIIRPPRKYPRSWREEDTILGDFLRAAEKHRRSEGGNLDLLPLTEEHAIGQPRGLPSTASTLLADVPDAERTGVLDQATLLGVELLRGGKPKLVHRS